ncbi:hypothetical protein A3C09_00085 [Candidatus Uhrbacteria bacterium RIFCSPHIGHO2_02_FULL_47_44]|uniref:Uncharacterized protein n=1 Tax=Candidatus Uhrbacteria bacterium RIFCSPLOWO2_02_FULL_48_18 TaxID=1802408 RepID=A0A1F7V7S8_9BACT|nr:MAG: hypothetical protein A2839_01760 [Candidatus Uhrbacteria bacterium RIFCSPHIGHO2_01_FULL_47_10]OGL71616.1 MAG: hypothetical protein A3C09_00085 [Candidatus Uhrbacteria bacterium RIFCSPHIGHO2_02_FULL_47_44]OGL76586.1 MAG: hypothetical protein A3E97_04640 [Candidatus Uhrbacteria bacterium RIFCSPHIGHO2_12_FULL_47_12]OGL80785.1 MAG: hypothetical protein A3B20_05370 [Candidatus Uhrbacteria bacterium RIFCSPLOWO2_01_FULL_47_17]OGL86563.1 MAG: hypothetical protein A3I41_04730 [Candidatus Uhrbact
MATIIQLFAKRLNPPRIMLFDHRNTASSAWSKHIGQKLPLVHVYHGEFGDLARDTDAIVVPTNNAGVMAKEFVDYFGDPVLERRLKSMIRSRFSDKLLLGQAVLVETSSQQFPYVICTPFVRSDGVRGNEPTNAYVATRAIMDLWRFGLYRRRIIRRLLKSIAMPFLAPDTGTFSMDTVAKEQLRALEETYSAYSETQRRHPYLSLVPDISKV